MEEEKDDIDPCSSPQSSSSPQPISQRTSHDAAVSDCDGVRTSSSPSLKSSDRAASAAGGGGGGDFVKCTVCRTRHGRKACILQACVQCCSDPNCEPHREVRDMLRKKESILDGTDWITRTAAKKRAERVAPGMFFDSNIQYFGETVVLWDVREFLAERKWREDAMRRSRGHGCFRKDNGDGAELGGDYTMAVGKKRRRKSKEQEGEDEAEKDATTSAARNDGDVARMMEKKPISRRKRFRAIWDQLYQKSWGQN